MVEHHLLLPDVAIRRDLTDPATIRKVADAVGDAERLDLLHALTEADSLATGPSAWGSWKAQLVADLVERTRLPLTAASRARSPYRHVPRPGDAGDHGRRAASTCAPRADDPEQPGDEHGTERITVVCDDLPGAFARIAGVLSLRGLDVLTAWAYSGELGGPPMAASQFRVVPPRGGVDWEPVHRRPPPRPRRAAGHRGPARRAGPHVPPPAARPGRSRRGPPSVTFHDDESHASTVIEVRAPNSIGVLHRIAKALAELGLDIRHATVQTLGEEVVDTFYVQGRNGRLHRRRVPPRGDRAGHAPRRVLTHRVTRLAGMEDDAAVADGPEGFTRDLARWSEALAAIARTGLGFTESLYERERFEEVLHVAADIKAAVNQVLGSTISAEEARRDRPASRTTSCRSGWSRSASACPATSPRRSPSARSSATTTASCCSCSGPTPGSGCTRPGGPTSATRRPRSPSRRSLEETGIECEPQRGCWPSSTGSGWASPASGCTCCSSTARPTGGELQPPPAGVRRRRLVRPRRAAREARPARSGGRRWRFAAIDGEDFPTIYDAVRSPIWRA